MKLALRFSPLWIGVILLAAYLIYINLPQDQASGQRPNRATPVTTEIVKLREFPVTVLALGTAKANESTVLTAKESDIVTQIAFDDGERVEANALLAQLNDSQEQARLNEVQTNLDEAQRQLERVQNLAKTNSASAQLLDEQQARVNALMAQLEVAQANLAEKQVRAPFAGVLGLRNISLGAFVRAGETITTLDDIDSLKVDFSLPEKHLPGVKIGQKVFATSVAYPGEIFNGVITGIDSRVDPVTRSINVRTEINNQAAKLLPGMLLQVVLQKRVLNTLVLNEKALVPDEDKQFVFTVVDDKAVKTEVVIGERKPGLVEIVSGLNSGDEVVVQGTLRIRQGSSLNVLNRGE